MFQLGPRSSVMRTRIVITLAALAALISTALAVKEPKMKTVILPQGLGSLINHTRDISNDLNDDELGSNWLLDDDDSNSTSPALRQKRAVGTKISDTITTLVEVASQTIGTDEVDKGDTFTYKYIVDLPQVKEVDKSDMNIEFFGIEPETGVAAFHICQPFLESKGDKVFSIQEDAFYDEQIKDGHTNFVSKSKIKLEQIHTKDYGAADDLGKVILQFQAVLLNVPEVVTNSKYYVTAGAEYSDGAYVFINQASVTTALEQPTEYDTNIQMSVAPTTMKKGDASLFVVSAFITNPSASLEFAIYQPLGYSDIFHIGQVSRTLGNAFACSKDEYWVEKYSSSSSRLTTNNVTVSYPLLINREAERDVTKELNRITFEVPVQILNTETIGVGISRLLTFSLRVGMSKAWTALHEITILDVAQPAPTPQPITIVSVTPTNKFNDASNSILAGDAATFTVKVKVSPGWANLDTVIKGSSGKGVLAIGARVVRTGLVAYFPPHWTCTSKTSDEVRINFGDVKNVSPNRDTEVEIEVSFSTDKQAANSTVTSPDIAITIGGKPVSPLSVNIKSNKIPTTSIAVAMRTNNFTTTWRQSGKVSMELVATLPAGAGLGDFFAEAVPDTDVTDYNVKLCRLKIHTVGQGVPCLDVGYSDNQETYTKTLSTKPFFDYGSIEIGHLCPAALNNPKTDTNQFRFSFFYELPRQTPAPTDASDYHLSGGFRTGTETVWIGSEKYTIEADTFNGLAIVSTHSSTLTEPFVTAYPLLTTRGRTTLAFDNKEGVRVQYLIKVQPLTSGDYKFTIKVPPKMKMCRLVISHIGGNLPCMAAPGPTAKSYDNIEINYAANGGTANACGEAADITFYGLSNFGEKPIVTDLTPDDDSIQVQAYMQMCADTGTGSGAGEVNVQYVTTYGTTDITKDFKLQRSDVDKAPTSTLKPSGMKYSSLIGPDNIIYKNAPKLMKLEIPVPGGYLGNLTVELVNDQYDTNIPIDFCGGAVVGVGNNVPCVNLDSDVVTALGTESKEVNGRRIYKSWSLTVIDTCYIDVDRSLAASMITIEAAIKVPTTIPDDSTVSLSLTVIPVSDTLKTTTTIGPLTVKTPKEGDIPVDTILPTEPKVMGKDATVDPTLETINTGETRWVTFHVQMPVSKTVKMEGSFLMPTKDNVALLTAEDIKFEDATNATSKAMNVLCTSTHVDIKTSYDVTFTKTSNTSTFMQKDAVNIDFGYMVNSGFTKKTSTHDASGGDDDFAISIKVRMSDAKGTDTNEELKVYFAVKFDQFIIVSSVTLKPNRLNLASRLTKNGNLLLGAQTDDEGKKLQHKDKVTVTTVIKHAPDSAAEAYPGILKVYLPSFMSYVDGQDSFSTNYSVGASPGVEVVFPSSQSANTSLATNFYFKFNGGITYSDIISFNFTLTVDPFKLRLPGSGDVDAAVALLPKCRRNIFVGHPIAGKEELNCGDMVSLPLSIMTPECHDPIPIISECQVSASSMINSAEFKPFNALSSNAAWAPAVRDLPIGQEYLEFDFLNSARINGVRIGTNANINGKVFRPVKKVSIKVGYSRASLRWVKDGDLSINNVVNLDSPEVTRFVRITVVEWSSNDVSKRAGINGIQFLGCMPRNHVHNSGLCIPTLTRDASQRTSYRHFAVDDLNDIVYFCDINPLVNEMRCFSSARQNGGNKWNLLPSHVKQIVGYSASRGRMFLSDAKGKAKFSSFDGVNIELTDVQPLDVNAAPALVVKGDVASQVGEIHWTGKLFNYKATFEGLYKDTTLLAKWKSCCVP